MIRFASPWVEWKPSRGEITPQDGTDRTDESHSTVQSVGSVGGVPGSFVPPEPIADAYEPPRRWAARVYLRLLDAELWVVETPDEAEGFAVELQAERDARPVVTLLELAHVAEMLQADAADAARVVLDALPCFPGARLLGFGRGDALDA